MGILRYIFLVVLFCSFTVPYNQQDKDLVLHLDFRKNQGKRPQDEKTINYCSASGTTLIHEVNGYRLSSGGSDFIDCGNSEFVNMTTQLTFSLWVYMNSNVTAMNKQTAAGSGFSYNIVMNSDNKIYFQLSGNGTTVAYGNTTVTYPLNQWVHIVGTYNGGGSTNADKLKIYFNGIEKTGLTFVGTIPTSLYRTSTNLRMNVLNGSSYGNGKFGLVRLFKKTLNHTEVMREYINTKATNR